MATVVVGLGNPGSQYDGTRHNVGFAVIDALARRLRAAPWNRGFASLWTSAHWSGHPLTLVKPQTFMNRSGEAVRQVLGAWRLAPAHLLVVYDDMDLPVGWLRLRPRGSGGGHRGMASIIQHLGTQDFPRLRIGIGRPPAGMDPAEYVLAPFAEDEKPLIQQVVERAADAVLSTVAAGLERAMSRYNGAPEGGDFQVCG